MKTYIIDGYNVIYKIPQLEQRLDDSLQSARQALVDLVRTKSANGNEYVIVFEGKNEYSGFNEPDYAGNIKLVFTKTGEEADRRIIDMLKNREGSSGISVVSDDNYVRNHAKAFRADVVSAVDFFKKRRNKCIVLLAIICLSANFAFAMPDQQETAIGRGVDQKLKNQYGVFENADMQKYIDHVGIKIVSVSGRQDIVYHFVVLNSSDINAFASVGGYVYITKGLILKLENEAQLAAALATEIVHVAKRHMISQLEKDIKRRLNLYAGAISTKKDEVLCGIRAAYDRVDTGFNKKLQSEADILGAEYLLRAGYDPHAMIQYLDVIQMAEKENKTVVGEFSRTHHKTTKRVDVVRLMLENLRLEDPVKYDSVIGNFFSENYKKSVLDIIHES